MPRYFRQASAGINFNGVLRKTRAQFRYHGAFFTAEETVCVSAGHNGELRRFHIRLEEQSEDQEILVYFRPVLTRQSSYLAHPAFSSLSVMTFSTPNGVVFRKLDEPDRVLAVKWNAKGASWTTNRFHAVNGVEWGGGPGRGLCWTPVSCCGFRQRVHRWSFSLP